MKMKKKRNNKLEIKMMMKKKRYKKKEVKRNTFIYLQYERNKKFSRYNTRT